MRIFRNLIVAALVLLALAGGVKADVSLVQTILDAPSDAAPIAGELLPIESGGNLKSVSVYALMHTGVASFNGRVGDVTLGAPDLGTLLTFGCPLHDWVNSLNVAGTFACAQPSFADLSGQIAPSQLPPASLSNLGGVEAVSSVIHEVVQYIDNLGVPHLVQLAFSDIGGTLPNSQLANAPANTIKGNSTGANASEQDISVPSCSGAANALIWVTNSGFSCNTIAGFVPQSYLHGLTLSTAGSSSTFGVAAGQAADSTNIVLLTLSSAWTKTTAAWSSGPGNGCLDSGTIANNTWYAEYIIAQAGGASPDVICTKASAGTAPSPSLPGGYTLERYIGEMETDGSGHWVAFVQIGKKFIRSPVLESASSIGATANLYTLTVPLGVTVEALYSVSSYDTGGNLAVIITSPLVPDVAPALNGLQSFTTPSGQYGGGQFQTLTNTSGQIRGRSNIASTGFAITSFGWIDPNLGN